MRRTICTFAAVLLSLVLAQIGIAQTKDQSSGEMKPSGELFEQETVSDEERQRFYSELPYLQEVQKRWEDRILSVPGVVSIGISRRDGNSFFLVTIDSNYKGGNIPNKIDDIEVIVERRGAFRLLHGMPACTPPCHADETPLPVEMGNSARWFQLKGGCTAGFKACDLSTGKLVFVTNSHCAQFPNGCALAPLGDPVVAPADGDRPPGAPSRTVGRISGHAAPSCAIDAVNFVDATKVDSTAEETSPVHRDIGLQSGNIAFGFPGLPIMVPGELVQSSGRTSGKKFGHLVGVNVTVNVPAVGGFCCGALRMYGQLVFDAEPNFTSGGDSGSGVLTLDTAPGIPPNRDKLIAGLLFGKDDVGTYFNSIVYVQQALNLTTDLSRCD